jgi:FKBP-type peptidyl-prolyl cis-trans isomerase
MNIFRISALFVICAILTACGQTDAPEEPVAADEPAVAVQATTEKVDIAPGLTMRVLKEGDGATAQEGDIAVVHYTGWLFDPDSADNKGTKFDSSVDRDQHFQFPLGAQRVIRGWDLGVVGMREGEKRELTIAPEMGYGERGAGGLIPPGATLVFDVELVRVQSTKPEVDLPKSPGGE